MTQQPEKVVKKGIFKRLAYSSAKRYTCEKGELTLTRENLLVSCEGKWSKSFPIMRIFLYASDENLEVRDEYDKLRFKLAIDSPDGWVQARSEIVSERLSKLLIRAYKADEKRPAEIERLLDTSPLALEKLNDSLKKERLQFAKKNIRFNLDIQRLLYDGIRNRKLKAFIVAHSYVAWYEWSKRLFYKIYKAKFGKGPKDDEELMKFLDDYPSCNFLDTTKWGIKANQIRNSVSHEKFYFDYKNSELVFMVKKEKRVRLVDLRSIIPSMAHFYVSLLTSLREKIAKETSNEHKV
jgi:hypothetical protein